MEFKKLKLEDKTLLDKYIYPYKFLNCEYSFTTLYIWREACDIQYTIFKDTLIIKKTDFEGNYYFMQPLGYSEDDLKDIIKKLSEYKKEHHMKYLFKDLEESFINKVKPIIEECKDIYIEEDRDNFDYLYESENLIKLSGRKYHGKKNHYNSFVKKYDYEVEMIDSEEVCEDVSEAAQIWYDNNDEKDDFLYYEMLSIKEVVKNMKFLNLQGMAVYVDNKIAGFTIGERLNDKLAVVHIEKGSEDCDGVYSFINRTFVDKCFKDIKIINREQDMGIEGLRKAKMSYHPVKLEKKFILSAKCK